MPDQIVKKLWAVKNAIEDEIRASNDRLGKLEASIAEVKQRLDDLSTTMYAVDESISLLDKPKTEKRHIPLPRGMGMRVAFNALRDAGQPLSVKDLAAVVLKVAGVAEPDDVQLQAVQSVLYGGLGIQVRQGRITEHATTPKTYSVPANAGDPEMDEALDEPFGEAG